MCFDLLKNIVVYRLSNSFSGRMVDHFCVKFGDLASVDFKNDTIDLGALKIWRDDQLNLAHGTQTKK